MTKMNLILLDISVNEYYMMKMFGIILKAENQGNIYNLISF